MGGIQTVRSDSAGVSIFITEEAIDIRTEVVGDLMSQVKLYFFWNQ